MSKKPLKKSDLDKEWIKPRESRTLKKINPEYHLIVTEGTKTEPLYFQRIKDIINKKYRGKISIRIEGEGKNTLDLLKVAREYVSEEQNQIRHVWLVYDKEDFPKDKFDKTEAECQKFSTSAIKYHALWSNQCIELWFLLHFIYFDSDITRNEYSDKLDEQFKKKKLGKYKKNRLDIYDILNPYRKTAIKNAKILRNTYEIHQPSKMSPMTMVYEFLEKMDFYLT